MSETISLPLAQLKTCPPPLEEQPKICNTLDCPAYRLVRALDVHDGTKTRLLSLMLQGIPASVKADSAGPCCAGVYKATRSQLDLPIQAGEYQNNPTAHAEGLIRAGLIHYADADQVARNAILDALMSYVRLKHGGSFA